ncbi:MAG: GNAT family N-acetyltransferase, partial [Defluviitaleaceae bacterium]|nr:GNAT family N-acetyltransferase [Defluviitaleaceae bacterium]
DPPKDRADEAELNFAAGIENDEDWYPMVVFKKDTGEFLGTCSIVPADGGKSWDFGYAVHKKFWRQGRNSEGVPVQGYATEILQALIGLGKEKGINIFTAKVAQENEASNAVLKKLGFRISCYSESFRKRNTDIIYPEYTYMLEI